MWSSLYASYMGSNDSFFGIFKKEHTLYLVFSPFTSSFFNLDSRGNLMCLYFYVTMSNMEVGQQATNDYFHHPSSCRYFSKLIDLLFSPFNIAENVKNAHRNFPEPKVTSSDCYFCPTNRPNPKDSSSCLK